MAISINFDFKNLQDYTVKILNPNDDSIVGTGFFFHPEVYILTCYHVIDAILITQKESTSNNNLFRISVNYTPEKIEAKFVQEYSLKEADIAVLKVNTKMVGSCQIRYLPLEIHEERWNSTSEKITCFGYPDGPFIEDGIQASGEISGTTKIDNIPVFQIGGFGIKEIRPGYSGSPVICLRTKKVIGLIYATYPKQENLAFFVSFSSLVKYWEKNWNEAVEFHDTYRKIRKEISLEFDRLLQQKLQNSEFISLGLERGDIPKKKKDHNEDFSDRDDPGKLIHQREWHNFSINDLMPPRGSYLLSSDVGFGKTTYLYWLACEINKNFDNFAVCIPCSAFAEWKPESWDDLKGKISNFFKPLFQNISADTFFINDEDIMDCFDFYFSKNKIIFFYDALDQMSEKTMDRSRLVKTVMRISSKNYSIISSRPLALIDFDKDSSATFLRLMHFSKDDEGKYFGKYFGTIGSVRALAPELKRVPMLAFMVKTLAINGSIKEVKNRSDLYERFINHIFTQQNIPRTADCQRISVKEELERISIEALNTQPPSIQIIPLDAKYIKRDMIESILKYGLINYIVEEDKDYLSFTHT